MSLTDTVLVFLAAFVLVSTLTAPDLPLQTVLVSTGTSDHAAYAVPITHRDLSSIRNRLESYGEAADHPLLGTNRWIAEASRYYMTAAEPLWQQQPALVHSTRATIRQVSHQASEHQSATPHESAARSWQRIATEAEERMIQIQNHRLEQLQNLSPAPVKLGGTVNVYWTRSSLIMAVMAASIVLLIVVAWERACPTRLFQPLPVPNSPVPKCPVPKCPVPKSPATHSPAPQSTVSGINHQWIAMEVLPGWIRLHQTNGAMLRRTFVALLVLGAIASLCVSFTNLA